MVFQIHLTLGQLPAQRPVLGDGPEQKRADRHEAGSQAEGAGVVAEAAPPGPVQPDAAGKGGNSAPDGRWNENACCLDVGLRSA